MKRWIFSSIVVLFLSVASSTFFGHEISNEMISLLYSVVGILFSVSMSMIISFNTQGVKNREVKKSLKTQMKRLMTNAIMYFSSLSVLMLIQLFFQQVDTKDVVFAIGPVTFRMSCLLVWYSSLCIVYYIVNFTHVYELNNNIEEQIDGEE